MVNGGLIPRSAIITLRLTKYGQINLDVNSYYGMACEMFTSVKTSMDYRPYA